MVDKIKQEKVYKDGDILKLDDKVISLLTKNKISRDIISIDLNKSKLAMIGANLEFEDIGRFIYSTYNIDSSKYNLNISEDLKILTISEIKTEKPLESKVKEEVKDESKVEVKE